ncbi:MAG: DUF2059 domain-containing protein [Acidiferrobacterales bacterium]|nr:DUF2059 domain-containing protein [Acidiferrobacterales bacterium]
MRTFCTSLKKPISLLSILSIALLASSIATAKVAPESIVEILKLSGLTTQVGEYPRHFKAGFDDALKNNSDMSEELHKAFVSAADTAFKSSDILFEVAVGINQNMEEEEIQEILSWYRSDLGKRITQEEELASTPEAHQIIQREMTTLLNDFERAGFARSIEKLFNATELSLQIQENIALASLSAATSASDPQDWIDPEQLRPQIRADLEKTREATKENIVASLIYSHRNIGLRELIKYEMFLTEDATVKFHQTTFRTLGEGLEKAVNRWAAEAQSLLQRIET